MDNSIRKIFKNCIKKEANKRIKSTDVKPKKNVVPQPRTVIVNLRTGKPRNPKQDEIRIPMIDHSDISLEDGDLIILEMGEKKYAKKKKYS